MRSGDRAASISFCSCRISSIDIAAIVFRLLSWMPSSAAAAAGTGRAAGMAVGAAFFLPLDVVREPKDTSRDGKPPPSNVPMEEKVGGGGSA